MWLFFLDILFLFMLILISDVVSNVVVVCLLSTTLWLSLFSNFKRLVFILFFSGLWFLGV